MSSRCCSIHWPFQTTFVQTTHLFPHPWIPPTGNSLRKGKSKYLFCLTWETPWDMRRKVKKVNKEAVIVVNHNNGDEFSSSSSCLIHSPWCCLGDQWILRILSPCLVFIWFTFSLSYCTTSFRLTSDQQSHHLWLLKLSLVIWETREFSRTSRFPLKSTWNTMTVHRYKSRLAINLNSVESFLHKITLFTVWQVSWVVSWPDCDDKKRQSSVTRTAMRWQIPESRHFVYFCRQLDCCVPHRTVIEVTVWLLVINFGSSQARSWTVTVQFKRNLMFDFIAFQFCESSGLTSVCVSK